MPEPLMLGDHSRTPVEGCLWPEKQELQFTCKEYADVLNNHDISLQDRSQWHRPAEVISNMSQYFSPSTPECLQFPRNPSSVQEFHLIRPSLLTQKCSPLQNCLLAWSSTQKQESNTWLDRLPRPMRKLSGLTSLWIKLLECTYSTLLICQVNTELTLQY